MRRIQLLTGAVLALAMPAAAAPLDEAKRILDATAPMHCELLKMHFQARTLPRDSAARDSLMQEYGQRSAAIEQALAADMQRFDAARALLDGPGYDEVTAHGLALMQACARQVERETGLRIPMPPLPVQPKVKVAPYVPAEKSLGVQAAPAAPIQGQDPQ